MKYLQAVATLCVLVHISARPVTKQTQLQLSARSSHDVCNNRQRNDYNNILFNIKQNLNKKDSETCEELISKAFPGQSLGADYCTVRSYYVWTVPRPGQGKLELTACMADWRVIAHFSPDEADPRPEEEEEEGSSEVDPTSSSSCSVEIKAGLTTGDSILGGDLAFYKLPHTASNNSNGSYTVHLTDKGTGVTVASKTVRAEASGWQIATVDEFLQNSFNEDSSSIVLQVAVKSGDGSELSCSEIKSMLALDCSVQSKSSDHNSNKNTLPAMSVYLKQTLSFWELLKILLG